MPLGLPNINIIFQQLAASAVTRGSKGVVALILQDPNHNTGSGVLTMSSVADIPSESGTGLLAYNVKQIQNAFAGSPSSVIAYINTEVQTSADYATAMAALETVKWHYLAAPALALKVDNTEDTLDSVSTKLTNSALSAWVVGLRDNKDIKVKAVLPHSASDHEGIINFATDNITVGPNVYNAVDYCSRIAGILAGMPLSQASTYQPLMEVTDVPHFTVDQFNTAIGKGCLVLINDGVKVKIARGINSLVTTTATKGSSFQKIKIVDILDQMHDDIHTTIADNYIGKVPNDYDDKMILVGAIQAYYDSLASQKILNPNVQNTIDIDEAAQTIYLKSVSYKTTDGRDISQMTEQEIRKADTGDKGFYKSGIKPQDAMEEITLVTTM